MPLVETEEQKAIRIAAEILTSLRREAAEHERREVTMSIDTLSMFEAQIWTAYAELCAK